MQLQKLTWVSMTNGDINSIDVHPDNSRFAVAQAGQVTLFRLRSIISQRRLLGHVSAAKDDMTDSRDLAVDEEQQVGLEERELDKMRQQICTVEHPFDIHCVRFAPASRPNLLATAAADGVVTLYERVSRLPNGNDNDDISDSDDSGEDELDKENWERYHTFRSHVKDAHAVEWSPDGKFLASCGLDNFVRIYDVEQKTEIKVLPECTGFVRSLAWDPVGTYLAAQVGDQQQSIVVYNARLWTLEKTINESCECFKSPPAAGLRTQLSWSPNGQYLLGTAGRVGSTNVAPMFSRARFDLVYMFAGHKEATTVAEFNPVLFEDPDDPNGYLTYFAVGSMDKRISIWSNKQREPVALLAYFAGGVISLAWSKDGMTLLASSEDGTVNSVTFEDDELGKPLSKAQMRALLRREYGDISDYAHLLEEYDPTKTAIVIRPKSKSAKETAAVPVITNMLQVRRPDEEEEEQIDLQDVQLEEEGSSLKRPRESEVVLEERFSKRLRLLEEEQTTFNIRLTSMDAELRCTHNQHGGEVEFFSVAEKRPRWRIHLKDTPALAVSNAHFTAIATKERMLYIVSAEGRRISPGMVTDSPVAFMACSKSKYLVIICDNCNMYAWNVTTQQCILDINVVDLLTLPQDRPQDMLNSYELISTLGITDEGTVVLQLYTGESFAYDSLSWRAWVRVMDHNLFSAYKNFSSRIFTSAALKWDLTLRQMSEHEALLISKKPMSMQRDTHEEEDIEALMAVADALKDWRAYKNYAKLFVEQTSVEKLKEYLDVLVMSEARKTTNPDRVFDEFKLAGVLDRRVMLAELLMHLQRKELFVEIARDYEKLLHGLWGTSAERDDSSDFTKQDV